MIREHLVESSALSVRHVGRTGGRRGPIGRKGDDALGIVERAVNSMARQSLPHCARAEAAQASCRVTFGGEK